MAQTSTNYAVPNTSTTTPGKRAIQSGLSTLIQIAVTDEKNANIVVGAIQSLAYTETRPVTRIGEVGTDGTLEVVPNAKGDVTLTATRVVFDSNRIVEALGRTYEHIMAQRYPFDVIVTHFSNFPGALDRITFYENCWFTNLSGTYTQDNYIITETVNITAERVYNPNSTNVMLQTDSMGHQHAWPDSKSEQKANQNGMGTLDEDNTLGGNLFASKKDEDIIKKDIIS